VAGNPCFLCKNSTGKILALASILRHAQDRLFAGHPVGRRSGLDGAAAGKSRPLSGAIHVSTPSVVVRLLGPTDVAVLERVADDVFDNPIDEKLAREFISDPRHHLVVAISEDQVVVGMASAVHYVHPDKPAQLFINEVGVAESHQGQGVGSRLMSELLALGRRLGCTEAWVATEPDNKAARSLYEKAGGQQHSSPFVMYTFPLLKP